MPRANALRWRARGSSDGITAAAEPACVSSYAPAARAVSVSASQHPDNMPTPEMNRLRDHDASANPDLQASHFQLYRREEHDAFPVESAGVETGAGSTATPASSILVSGPRPPTARPLTTPDSTAQNINKNQSGILKAANETSRPAFLEVVDIALNLADVKWDGIYQDGKQFHAPDHAYMLKRTFELGKWYKDHEDAAQVDMQLVPCRMAKCMVSGGGLEWIRKAFFLMEKFDPGRKFLFTCIGVHPTMVKEFLFLPERFNPATAKVEVLPQYRSWKPPVLRENLPAGSEDHPVTEESVVDSRTWRGNDDGENVVMEDMEVEDNAVDQKNAVSTFGGGTAHKGATWGKKGPEQTSANYTKSAGGDSPGGRSKGTSGTATSKTTKMLKNSQRPVEVTAYGLADSRLHEYFADPSYQSQHLHALRQFFADEQCRKRIVAVGEIGLDYERTQFCPLEIQRRFLELQLPLAAEYDLPLYIHVRGAGCMEEFLEMLDRVVLRKFFPGFRKNLACEELDATLVGWGSPPRAQNRSEVLHGEALLGKDEDAAPSKFTPRAQGRVFRSGVVHSFTGTVADLELLLSYNLFVSVNGCSLRSKAGCLMIKSIPLDRLLLETDAPYCAIEESSPVWKDLKTANCSALSMNCEVGVGKDCTSGTKSLHDGAVRAGLAWGRVASVSKVGSTGRNDSRQASCNMDENNSADVDVSMPYSTPVFPEALAQQTAALPALQAPGGRNYSTQHVELEAMASANGSCATTNLNGQGAFNIRGNKGRGKKGKKGKRRQLTPVEQIQRRNEPINVLQVAEAVALLRGEPIAKVLRAARENTRRLLGI
ncbi:unnamed protein product [Amoebophrya sp. A120]|nr:unnamed protein product [Amoebophrya sp. A120]|eukprot:GSA120T00005624001.1